MNIESLCGCHVCGETSHTIKTCCHPDISIWWNNILREIQWSNDITSMLEDMHEINDFICFEIPFNLVTVISIQYAKAEITKEIYKNRAYYIKCILDAVSKEILDWHEMTEVDQINYLNNIYKSIRIDCKSTKIRAIQMPIIQSNENLFISPYPNMNMENVIDVTFTQDATESQIPETNYIQEIEENINITEVQGISITLVDTNTSLHNIECPICYETTEQKYVNKTNCDHEYCHGCFTTHLINKNNCPLCRGHILWVDVKSNEQIDNIRTTLQNRDMEIDNDSLPALISDSDFDSDYELYFDMAA